MDLMSTDRPRFDALLPPEMAARAEDVGVRKARLDAVSLFALPAAFWNAIDRVPADFPELTVEAFLVANLLPVTIGNIIGGAVMVGIVYWFVYLRGHRPPALGTKEATSRRPEDEL